MKNKSLIAFWLTLGCMSVAVRADSPKPDEENLRDPFWPIDYNGPNASSVAIEPKTNQDENAVKQPDQSSSQAQVPENQTIEQVPEPKPQSSVAPEWPKLKIKGVMKGPDGKYVANIEGIGVVEAGRKCKAVSQGFMFIYRIEEITAEGVKLTPVEARPLKQQ